MTLDNFRSIDLTLDFANQYLSAPEVTAVAGDASGRKLHLTITDKGVVQDLTSQNIVLYWKHNALGNSGMATFTATDPKNGVFDLFLPTELLHSGRVDANIQVVDSPSHSAVMSRALIIRVESSAYDDKAAMATNAYTSLQDILTLWQTLPKQIQDWLTKYANVQINQGGTGASTRPAAFNNLAFIGTNPITSPANDTPANWSVFGSGYAWYSQLNALNHQPGIYGHLIQYNNPFSQEILQIFSVSITGEMYYRKANGNGWLGNSTDDGTWTRLSDSRNPIPVLAADASSTGMSYTITNSTVSNSFPNGYTFKFIPNVTSSTTSATLSINGSTPATFYRLDSYSGALVAVTSDNTWSNFLDANNVFTVTNVNGKWLLTDLPFLEIDYAQAHPVGSVISNTSSSSSGYTAGSWSLIGSTTVYHNLNLLDGSSSTLKTVSAAGWGYDYVYQKLNTSILIKGQTYTYNIWIQDCDVDTHGILYLYDSQNKQYNMAGNTIKAGTSGFSTVTFTVGIDVTTYTVSISFFDNLTDHHNLSYKNIKLEKGSTATPHMPSQQEVTTTGYSTDVESTTLYYWKRTA